MEQIIDYIRKTYAPLSIILYGSYADGSNNLNSDFDALVITREHRQLHDTSIINGIALDVFVYPASYFSGGYDCNEFIQIFDGKILSDTDDLGKTLQENVLSWLKILPRKSPEEMQEQLAWCLKMVARTQRGDAEGMFRWHWLLTDSLEIFCDITRQLYFGPKKTLKWMNENHPTAFALYEKALRDFTLESLETWISYLNQLQVPV